MSISEITDAKLEEMKKSNYEDFFKEMDTYIATDDGKIKIVENELKKNAN
jgi:hypothetical protein